MQTQTEIINDQINEFKEKLIAHHDLGIKSDDIVNQLKEKLLQCEQRLDVLSMPKINQSCMPLTSEEKEKYFQIDVVVRIASRVKNPNDCTNLFAHNAKISKDLFRPNNTKWNNNIRRSDMITFLQTQCETKIEKIKILDKSDYKLNKLYQRLHPKIESVPIDQEKLKILIKSLFNEYNKFENIDLYRILGVRTREYSSDGRQSTCFNVENEGKEFFEKLVSFENNKQRTKMIILLS